MIHHVRRLEKGAIAVPKPQVYENSSVLPPADAPPTGAETPRKRTPSVRRKAGTASAAKPGPRTLSLRKPAFLLLAAWLAFLAYHVFWPVSLLLPARLMPTRGGGGRGEGTPGGIVREESNAWASRYGGREGPGGAYGNRADRMPTTPELEELRTDVADALCAGRFEAALTLVEEDLALPHSDLARPS